MTTPEFVAFNDAQNGIYQKFEEAQAEIPTAGVQVDAGTEPQSAYLVAWRFPEQAARDIAEFSEDLASIIPSVTYGFDAGRSLDNAHVTLTDYGLKQGFANLHHGDDVTFNTLDMLATAVEDGINEVGGLTLPGDALRFDAGVLHNGRTAIMPGQASPEIFKVRRSVLQNAGSLVLKGAWGAHSTVSRVLESRGPESSAIPDFMDALQDAPRFGAVRPSSLDVGYFNVSPEDGFRFTPVERFDVTPGTAISMHIPNRIAE
jgi:hypothetical protein